MEWVQVLTIIAANFVMILWCMHERRADFLYITKLIEEMKDEMKDFHGRLERLDADFKNHLMNHREERNKGK